MNWWQKMQSLFTNTPSKKGCQEACPGCACKKQRDLSLSLSEKDTQVLHTIDRLVMVGKVLEVAPHPDPKMTKVRVSQVDLGNGKTEQILCGGINLKAGQIVPVATVGAKLGEDFTIGVRDIRGVESRGMICARSELGLNPSGEQKGEIWVLPENFETVLGTSLNKLAS